jgi:hypothetical protein
MALAPANPRRPYSFSTASPTLIMPGSTIRA